MQTETINIHELPALLAPDSEREAVARSRQAAVWKGQKPDRWPILVKAPLTTEQEQIPAPNIEEAFYDEDMMLFSQVRQACTVANARSDAVPSIRANLGTGVLLSCIGLEQDVFSEKMPWLSQHLTKQQISALEPDDIRMQGTFERGIKQMKHFKEVMGDSLAIYCMDTQGPFDLAHLMMGPDIFYEIHDDPPFVRHVLDFCVQLNKQAHEWIKAEIGEPIDCMHHRNGLYTESAGVRICEDTTAVVSPETMEELILPYTSEVARYFGGAWVHYCGRNDDLTKALCRMPEVKGINFGLIPGHVHDHPFEEDMQLCFNTDTVYFGNWPRYQDETGEAYLKRLYRWASCGTLIAFADEAKIKGTSIENHQDVLDYWEQLHG